MANPRGILLYFDFETAFERLKDEQVGRLVKSLFPYVKSGVKPEFEEIELQVIFDVMRPKIDVDVEKYMRRCEANAANGRKGGKKRFDTDSNIQAIESDCLQLQTIADDCKQNGEKKNEEKIKNKENYNESKRELKENKEPLSYAEQYESACEKYGKAVLEDYLQRVETYQQSSGKVYADKLATACLWIERDIADNKLVIKNTTYDLDEYEKWAKTYTPKLSTQESKKGG